MGRNLDTKWNVNFLVLVTQSGIEFTCYNPNMAFLLNNLYSRVNNQLFVYSGNLFAELKLTLEYMPLL